MKLRNMNSAGLLSAAVVCLMAWSSASMLAEAFEIDAQFPGGNIIVDQIDQSGSPAVVKVRPDLRDTMGDWFYYAFRVRGAEGKTVRFVFDHDNRVGARGPAITTDDGRTWQYLSNKPNFNSREFTYTFGADGTSVIFSLAQLYQQRDWEQFIARYANNPAVKTGTLCRSRQGRAVEMVQISTEPCDGQRTGQSTEPGSGNPAPRWGVALTARHHCCEMTANFVLEGMIEEILSDSKEGAWLRANAGFFIVPFVDKDGVENGDQGKNRKPHDHNRDYNHDVYPEIRALKAEISQRFEGKGVFFLDVHCPWIRGGMNEYLYFPGPEKPSTAAALKEFSLLLQQRQANGAIPYLESRNLPFGQSWNTKANFVKMENGKPTWSSKTWAETLPGIVFASSIEVPYSNSSDVEVTPDVARELGENIARTICDYLKTKP